MRATFVMLWLQVVQPMVNVHDTKWTLHVKHDVAKCRLVTLGRSHGGSTAVECVTGRGNY